MLNAIEVIIYVLTDLLMIQIVRGTVVSTRCAVVAVLNDKMRSTSCLHADFLVCTCAEIL